MNGNLLVFVHGRTVPVPIADDPLTHLDTDVRQSRRPAELSARITMKDHELNSAAHEGSAIAKEDGIGELDAAVIGTHFTDAQMVGIFRHETEENALVVLPLQVGKRMDVIVPGRFD